MFASIENANVWTVPGLECGIFNTSVPLIGWLGSVVCRIVHASRVVLNDCTTDWIETVSWINLSTKVIFTFESYRINSCIIRKHDVMYSCLTYYRCVHFCINPRRSSIVNKLSSMLCSPIMVLMEENLASQNRPTQVFSQFWPHLIH